MSDAARPGAGAAVGLLLVAAVLAALGLAAYTAVSDDLPGKWIYAGVAAGLLAGQLLAFAGSVSLLTRGVASVAYLIAAVAAALLWLGVERDTTPLVFDLSLEVAIRYGLALLVLLGALALPAFPSTTPGRIAGALLAIAAVAPWAAGVVTGAPPEAILAGAGRFYEPWPWYLQPALLGGGLALLVLLVAGVAILGGRRQADQRILALGALLIPGLAGAVMIAYAVAAPGPAADARAPGEPAIDASAPAVTRRPVPDAGSAASGRYDCSNVIVADRDVAAIRDGFAAERWREAALRFLEARYPDAAWMIGTLEDPGHFDVWFKGQTDSFGSVMRALGTGVHEAAHMAGLQARRGRRHRYVLGKDDIVEIRVPETFDRAAIAERLPPEIRAMSYADTYLSGKSGAQGYEMVLEELNAYTYSLYAGIVTAAERPANVSTSDRDGLLTLMYYTEAYLKLARTEKPESYAAITGDRDLVAATIKLYDRAACVLALSGSDPRLGIEDAMLRRHVLGAERLGEIDRLR